MTDTYSIDNSIDGDIKRVILWQYDHAENLIAMLNILKDFFDGSTKEFWDGFRAMMNIANLEEGEEVSEFGLAVWGKLMGIARPVVTYQSSEESSPSQHPISAELYRKLLIGRFRLSNDNASIAAYMRFCSFVFGTNVKPVDGYDMSLDFVWSGESSPTSDSDKEQKSLVEALPDFVFDYPAGVRSSKEDDGPVFGFYEQVRDGSGNPLTENQVIDDQSIKTATYTYTVNGYTYTKEHKDFKIANLDHGVFAWNRYGNGVLATT